MNENTKYFKSRFNLYSKRCFECKRELQILEKLPVSYWLLFILFLILFISYDLEHCFNVELFSSLVFKIITLFYCLYCLFIFLSKIIYSYMEKKYLEKRIEYFNLYITSKGNKKH